MGCGSPSCRDNFTRQYEEHLVKSWSRKVLQQLLGLLSALAFVPWPVVQFLFHGM